MKSFPNIKLFLVIVLIGYATGKPSLIEQEEQIKKFADGSLPDPNEEIFKQIYHDTLDLYDILNDLLENVNDFVLGQTSDAISEFNETTSIIKSHVSKMQPDTDPGEKLKKITLFQIDGYEKQINQSLNNLNKERQEFMKTLLEILTEWKTLLYQDVQDINQLENDAIDLIRLEEEFLAELAKVKPSHTMTKVLIDDLSIIQKKIDAFCKSVLKNIKNN